MSAPPVHEMSAPVGPPTPCFRTYLQEVTPVLKESGSVSPQPNFGFSLRESRSPVNNQTLLFYYYYFFLMRNTALPSVEQTTV